jgi:hypothetical protein
VDLIPNRFVQTASKNNVNLLNHIGFNQSFLDVEHRDICILVGLNPRTEGSLINTRLRKRVLSGKIQVFSFGPRIELNFEFTQLGSNLSRFVSFLEGKHAFSKSLLKAKRPTILFGDSLFNTIDIVSIFQFITKKQIPFNLLPTRVNQINQSVFGLRSQRKTEQTTFLGFAIEEDALKNQRVEN